MHADVVEVLIGSACFICSFSCCAMPWVCLIGVFMVADREDKKSRRTIE